MRWLFLLMVLFAQPAFADDGLTAGWAETDPHNEVKFTVPVEGVKWVAVPTTTFRDKHPLIFHAAWPVRKVWNGCVWIGQKTEPIHPFLNLCSAAGSIATPFAARFK
jgi:hypothetical protein